MDFDFSIVFSKFAPIMNIIIFYVDGQVNLAEKINCKESQEREITEVLTIKKEMPMKYSNEEY